MFTSLTSTPHMTKASAPTPTTWSEILEQAYGIFDNLDEKGFGTPPFSLGGGTVLMFKFKHRLSKDIDLFGYDAQWLSAISPRLNEYTAVLATDYSEQANSIKIVTDKGDIDFIIAADITHPVAREKAMLAGRFMEIDPISEILAKKLYYRAAFFKARDIYDLSATIDLAPDDARAAIKAAAPKKDILLRRLDELETLSGATLKSEIIPYDGALHHGHGMIQKVKSFIKSSVPKHREIATRRQYASIVKSKDDQTER